MPREKYRVHEVAKDFGINSKKILEILEGNSPEPRKHMTALEDAELDLIFDTITKENEVESFDEYFAAGEREKAEKQAAAQNEAEEKTEALPERAERLPPKPKEEPFAEVGLEPPKALMFKTGRAIKPLLNDGQSCQEYYVAALRECLHSEYRSHRTTDC